MYYCDMVPSGGGELDRKVARYRLATLLVLEQFKEAESLSEKWLKEHIILSEDHAFVRGSFAGRPVHGKNLPISSSAPLDRGENKSAGKRHRARIARGEPLLIIRALDAEIARAAMSSARAPTPSK